MTKSPLSTAYRYMVTQMRWYFTLLTLSPQW